MQLSTGKSIEEQRQDSVTPARSQHDSGDKYFRDSRRIYTYRPAPQDLAGNVSFPLCMPGP